MKKTLTFAALLLSFASLTWAYDFSAVAPSGQTLYYYIISGTNTVTVISNSTSPSGALTIPSTVTYNSQTYSVTSIGGLAFYDCSGLTSVTIPNSVTSIGQSAFNGCTSLTSVTIPNSVTSIGNSAFAWCSGLASISVAAGNITYDSRNNCNAIIETSTNSLVCGCKNTTIPNSVTSIGGGAFAYCSGLTSVTIPNSVTSIGHRAFGDCSSLTSVTIPNSVTSIGYRAFAYCSGLTEITSLASVAPLLGEDAFDGVTSTIPVNIPCGSSTSYYSRWSYFSNFVEDAGFTFSATSEDSTKGAVQVLTTPTCTSPNAVVNAVANTGYRFDHWSDGSTANPYSFTLTQDTAIEAYFVPEGSEGVNDVEVEKVVVRVQDGQIVVGNAMGETIRIFDAMGRLLSTSNTPEEPRIFNLPAAGVYLVQVGDSPAQRVVVAR